MPDATAIGVFPVHELDIAINTGTDATASDLAITGGTWTPIKDLETVSPSFDGNVEEWQALDQNGWVRRLVTGKSCTLGFEGKRNVGDPGNDFVASKVYATGSACSGQMRIIDPAGNILFIPGVINVTSALGGAATDVSPLSFDFMSDGKPTLIEA
jgi:hypothetical protein